MKKFCLRHWRGNGAVIASAIKDSYYDYPKRSMNRNARRYSLAECIVQVITEQEAKDFVFKMYGSEGLERFIKRNKLFK